MLDRGTQWDKLQERKAEWQKRTFVGVLASYTGCSLSVFPRRHTNLDLRYAVTHNIRLHVCLIHHKHVPSWCCEPEGILNGEILDSGSITFNQSIGSGVGMLQTTCF